MMLLLFSKIEEAKHKVLLENNLFLLSEKSRDQLLRFRQWQDAQLSLLGKLLVKEGLHFFNINADLKSLFFTEYNKPYFRDNDIAFNISHSGELVVVVLTNEVSQIGVDIEKIHSIKMSDFEGQMTSLEKERVFDSNYTDRFFFKYWTQKEAVLKAFGLGLSMPLKSFEIKNNKTTIGSEIFYVSEISLNKKYVCHIAQNKLVATEKLTVRKIDIDRFID